MPRYFFNRTDGFVDHDEEGTELENLQAARVHAVTYAATSLQEDPSQVWKGQEFRVEVTDQDGRLLFTVVTLAIDSASVTRRFEV